MTNMHVALILSMVGVAPAHVSVQSGFPPAHVDSEPGPARSPRTFQITPAPAKDPFKHIFVVPPAQDRGVWPGDRPTISQPRVVCGMTLVPANPEVDPKMPIAREADPNREYKIRTIPPRICRE